MSLDNPRAYPALQHSGDSSIFPQRPLTLSDLLRFIWNISRYDALRLFIIGVGAGLLSLAVPAASGYVFEVILPYRDTGQLILVFVILLASALSLALFEFSRTLLTNRINARLDFYLQAGVWDRLVNLPVYQLRQFETGDLAERALGIKALKPFSTLLISTLLAFIFIIANTLLLLSLSTRLLLLALALVAISFFVNLLLGFHQQRNYRIALALRGKAVSFAFQLLENVAKIQVAQAAQRALAQWRGRLAEARQPYIQAQLNQSTLVTFNSGYAILASIAVFYATTRSNELDVAEFLVFNVAFTQIMTTLIGWSGTLISALSTMPYYGRLQPLLISELEVAAESKLPPRLTGALSLKNISFRYHDDASWILRDLSLEIAAGEWVAITGKIGSGKSTLLRLLLGFEKPVDGHIYLDGVDIATLNIQRVRSQIGTILQHDQPLAGTIRDVVSGGTDLSDEDLWRATQLACIDTDIRRMPMGLSTYVSESGTNLSGGQLQRLLLARALARRPMLLLLDEATSALDGETQTQVIAGLRALRITCLMVAHRPETLQYADRVYQMIDGHLSSIETHS